MAGWLAAVSVRPAFATRGQMNPFPTCDNQKRLQTLPSVHEGQSHTCFGSTGLEPCLAPRMLGVCFSIQHCIPFKTDTARASWKRHLHISSSFGLSSDRQVFHEEGHMSSLARPPAFRDVKLGTWMTAATFWFYSVAQLCRRKPHATSEGSNED